MDYRLTNAQNMHLLLREVPSCTLVVYVSLLAERQDSEAMYVCTSMSRVSAAVLHLALAKQQTQVMRLQGSVGAMAQQNSFHWFWIWSGVAFYPLKAASKTAGYHLANSCSWSRHPEGTQNSEFRCFYVLTSDY